MSRYDISTPFFSRSAIAIVFSLALLASASESRAVPLTLSGFSSQPASILNDPTVEYDATDEELYQLEKPAGSNSVQVVSGSRGADLADNPVCAPTCEKKYTDKMGQNIGGGNLAAAGLASFNLPNNISPGLLKNAKLRISGRWSLSTADSSNLPKDYVTVGGAGGFGATVFDPDQLGDPNAVDCTGGPNSVGSPDNCPFDIELPDASLFFSINTLDVPFGYWDGDTEHQMPAFGAALVFDNFELDVIPEPTAGLMCLMSIVPLLDLLRRNR